ncbi:MAG: hypothetical protein ACRC1T_09885 [Clostridium chrysemydis]|uniref:hypothetical protein n=1 Tax=Clostridium chrysemydis TaxID=2665504 RepID=UPI003F3F6620
MFDVKIRDIMNRDNSELYKLAIDILEKLKKDKYNLEKYDKEEEKRWFFQREIEKPKINFPDLAIQKDFMWGKEYLDLNKVIISMKDDIELINKLVIDGRNINEIGKSIFARLFGISLLSKDVVNYILEEINKEC